MAVIAGTSCYVMVDQVISSTSFDNGMTVNQTIVIAEVSNHIGQAELALPQAND